MDVVSKTDPFHDAQLGIEAREPQQHSRTIRHHRQQTNFQYISSKVILIDEVSLFAAIKTYCEAQIKALLPRL